jgi:ABC-type polar amino acid transport system ATPase subunit
MGFARRMANRVVFMDEGELVEQDVPAAFFGTPQTERAKRFLAKLED